MSNNDFDPLEFRVKFRAFFATLSFLFTMLLIFCAIFFKTDNIELLKYVLSFLMGSLLTVVITFYFDGNEIQGDLYQSPNKHDKSLISLDSDKER